MNHTSRFFIIILVMLIIHYIPFYIKIGYSSDSLKVGLIFKTFDPNQTDSLSRQLSKMLSEVSHLRVISIDTLDSILLEPFAIDSITLKQLKQQQFHGLILCKVSISDNINKLAIEAFVFNNSKLTRFEALNLEQENFSERLLAIVREVEIFFLLHQQSKSRFRIIFTPMNDSELDSSLLLTKQSLFDSLKKISTSPLFSKIEFEFFEIGSFKQSDLTDSALQKYGKLHQAHLIVTGKIEKDKQHNDVYYPYLVIPKPNDVQSPLCADDRLLSGKICQLRRFSLPAIPLKNFSNLTDFIKGYFLIQTKKYSDAIEQLKKLQSVPAFFYLAGSYFYQGITVEHDALLARADRDSSIYYWKKCLSQTDSHRDSVCTNNDLGVAFQLSGQMDSAVVYYSKANSDWTEINDNEDFIQISHNLGNCCLLKGQWKKALDIFQSTVQVMEKSNDSLSLTITYENLGHIYQLIFQRNKAIDYYQKALALRQKMHDEAGMANSFNFLGNAYQGEKDFKLAKNYFKQSLALNLQIHNEPQLANAYDNLGQLFQDTGELDSALIYFQKSYETYDMLDNKNGLVQTVLHQASVYQKQKKSDLAISLYEKALELIGDNNSRSLKAQIYDRLGDIYNNQNNLIPALDYYEQAADLYERAGNFETLSLILYNMGLIKLKQNDYAEGYQLLKKAISLDEEHGFNNLSGEKDFLDQLDGILRKD